MDKAPVNKAFTRVKSQTNLQKPRSKPTKIEPVHVLEEEPLGIEDIDENDLENPTLCAEYVKDIYRHMRKAEVLNLSYAYFICIKGGNKILNFAAPILALK